ncbi:unnamed protein product [Rangifer tarandus platyrhynchus]|uniref:Uncharacterized protein n=1 Tax=Rangifer tarandus platyrhynchus TaxID=3082113 RepID=A0AC59ZZF3_RANTA
MTPAVEASKERYNPSNARPPRVFLTSSLLTCLGRESPAARCILGRVAFHCWGGFSGCGAGRPRSRNSTECWRRSEKQLRCQEVAAGIEGEQELGGHLAGITTVELVKHKAQVLQQQAETESRIQLLSSPASRHTATLQVV